MTVSRDGITVRVRRRPVDRSRLAIEMIRARDELLARGRRAKARADEEEVIAAAAIRGKAVGYREAADLITAALDRATDS